MKILFFEDTDEQAKELSQALQQVLGESGEAVRFEAVLGESESTHEDRLKSELTGGEKYTEVDLIVADRDLSKTPLFRGLSEPTVRRVADALATPECSYTRKLDPHEFLLSADQREECIAIAIDKGWDDCARQIVSIASGFLEIRRKVEADGESLFKMSSPGEVMAAILGKPEYGDKLSLYASGDRQRVHSVLKMQGLEDVQRVRRLTCLFGYWLWDSILRYPGAVVDSVAASSYLNIKQEEFEYDEAIRDCFAPAKFEGPFMEAKGPLWWRGALDDIVAESESDDGRSYVEHTLRKAVSQSECCEDPNVPAGYYCMLSRKPVSMENSTGGLAWFPRGADLARVSKSQDEELGPWLS